MTQAHAHAKDVAQFSNLLVAGPSPSRSVIAEPRTVTNFGSRERFFVLTAGRTGSSLLCSILAVAGADFGIAPGSAWDESEGAFEAPLVTRSAGHFRDAYAIAPTKPAWPRSWIWSVARHRGKHDLGRALATLRYLKALNLDLAVPMAFRLGYFPRVIVSSRGFCEHVLSLSQMFSHMSPEAIERNYIRTYRNALMLLLAYGGCVVDYDALIDPGNRDWVAPLASLTGLGEDAIDGARAARLARKTQGRPPLPSLSAEADDICDRLRALSGRVIPPSDQALRSWAKRRRAATARER